MIFRPVRPAVSVRSPDHEPAGGIDVVLGGAGKQMFRNGPRHDPLLDVLGDLALADVFGVLRRHHDRRNAHGFAAVIFNRHLALAVGAQPIDLPALPRFREQMEDAMRQRDGQRHQLFRLPARVAEHQPLVPGAVAVDPHCDIARLAVQRQEDRQESALKPTSSLVYPMSRTTLRVTPT